MDDLLVFSGHQVYLDILNRYKGDDTLKQEVIGKLKLFFQSLNDASGVEQKENAISELSAELYKIRVDLRAKKISK